MLAIEYAIKYGWSVFPVKKDKTPYTKNGFKDSSKDPIKIKEMFDQFPDALIGVSTGKESGIVVLDIDVKNDAGGEESIRELEEKHGTLPETMQVLTPSGGRHYYFKYTEPIGRIIGRYPGIDILGDRGYVIAPSGNGSGYNKEVSSPDVFLDPPKWMFDVIPSSTRNNTLTSYAGKLRHNGNGPEEIYQKLKKINSKSCSPPLPDNEVKSIAISIGKYPAGDDVESVGVFDVPLNRDGKPIPNLDCVTKILSGIKYPIWFDTFHRRYFTTGMKEWSDIDDLNLTIKLQSEYGISRISDELVSKAVQSYAHTNLRNEPRDWFDSLVWDGELRISNFFINALGAEKNSYTIQASNNFWVGMVARVYRPGCKLDTMVVLEGEQGVGKTRALSAIGGKWHTESEESITSKDFFQCLDGKLIVEIAELDSFNRAEVTRIKQVISCSTDRYRSSYGRRTEDHPRQSVFVGTTNDTEYLKDHTGGRRFIPIRCGEINVEYIKENREQLFAEAVRWFKDGNDWHTMPKEHTKMEQESRRQSDEWEYIIKDFIKIRSVVTVKEIAQDCLKVDTSKLDMFTQKRIGRIMRSINWVKRQTWSDGLNVMAWHNEKL